MDMAIWELEKGQTSGKSFYRVSGASNRDGTSKEKTSAAVHMVHDLTTNLLRDQYSNVIGVPDYTSSPCNRMCSFAVLNVLISLKLTSFCRSFTSLWIVL
ncbi:hypothetical protein K1719_015215 [Acacia pycnantha]|nr:hypothetical protein K1719_015215 [Acacia pycnantha]